MATLKVGTSALLEKSVSIKGMHLAGMYTKINISGKSIGVLQTYRAYSSGNGSPSAIMIRRSILNVGKSLGNNWKMITIRESTNWTFSSSTIHSMDCEIEGSVPCHIPSKKKEECEIQKVPTFTYGTCKKVCMPCCRPVVPLKECNRTRIHFNTCKGIKYKYPSFVKTVHKIPFQPKWISDCCYYEECCRRTTLGSLHEIMPIVDRQRLILGCDKSKILNRVKKSIDQSSTRNFSTTNTNFQKDSADCEKQGELPCLKKSDTMLKKLTKNRKSCEKLCMPCCRPARDPPDCYFPYTKPKCVKKKAPRAAFSECQNSLRDTLPCECVPHTEVCKTNSNEEVGCRRKN